MQNGEERFLRQLDVTDLLHAFLTFFLLLQQLFLTADIAAITFSQYVFTQLFHGGSRNNVRTNRCLNGDIKLLAWDQIFHLLHQLATAVLRIITVGDQRQRINTFTVD
ncbi:Uncharacterised protein [Shigella sonnei]|nr:Uncharacterised protein [Shigella sonnei]CSG01197.1 Uncharacterised protein [Shigella sonnei]CSG36466.1 Uncharacterised protein [Shigella sonnei]